MRQKTILPRSSQKIATQFINPQKKGTKQLKKKDVNDGIAEAFNFNRLGYGSMTD